MQVCDSMYTLANYKKSDFSRPMATQTPSDSLIGLSGCDGMTKVRRLQQRPCFPLYEQHILASLASSDGALWPF